MDPLAPDGEQARQWLQDELRGSEYERESFLQILERKFSAWLASLFEGTATAGLGSTLISLVVLTAVVGLLIFVASRFRISRSTTKPTGELVTDPALSAKGYLVAAQRAYQRGDFAAAVVHGMRAAAQSQVERGTIRAIAGLTAQELARQVGERDPNWANDFEAAATVFDRVRYGDLPATREDADLVLALGPVATK